MISVTLLLFFGVIIVLLGLMNWQNREKPPTEAEIHECNARLQRWKKAKQDWDATDKNEYMPHRHAVDWKKRHAGIPKISERIVKELSRDDHDVYIKAVQLIENHEQKRNQRNKKFIATRLSDRREWFDQLNEHPLTPAQRQAVVVNEDNTLVVAAAGTGKTTTLEAKAAYMVDQGLCKPEEILVMAFNKKVAEEVRERISRNPSLPGVTVKTFHGLGSQIIGHCRGAIPALSPLAENKKTRLQLFKDVFQEKVQQDAFRREIQTWFTDNLVEREWVEKQAPTERFTALNGKIVASVSEVMVANWLLMNGIEFEHEKNYPHQHNSPRHRDYLPDFYLPQIDAWLEVWAVDGNGNTAPHIDAQQYVEAMTWKREFHQQHGTVLLEIDQDQVWSGNVGGHLESLLAARGLSPQPLTMEQFRALTDNSFSINNFCELIDTYIQLFRSGDYKEATVENRAQSPREKAFLRLVTPFMKAYVDSINSQDRIDFHDMLLRASALVNKKKFVPEWRCILVDETQDFSGARMELVKALKTHGPDVSVVLVGDDWQSIYRFTGADVSFFTEANILDSRNEWTWTRPFAWRQMYTI